MRIWLLTGAMPLLVVALVLALWPDAAWLETAVTGYPLALYVATVLLAWRFERSRLAAAAVLTVLAWLVLSRIDGAAWPRLIGPLSVLLPVAVAALAIDDDRPLRSIGGMLHVVLLVGMTSLAVALAGSPIAAIERTLAFMHVPPGADDFPPVSAPSLFAFLAAAALVVSVLAYRRHPADAGLLLLLPALFGMVAAPADGPVRAAWALAGGAVLTLAAIESAVALAYRDELTGLPSRRALGTALRSLRGPYAIAVADVDRFKSVNDTYGHETGDQVLRMVAAHLARTRGARAYRSGGEEFTLLFPGLETSAAFHNVEETRRAIDDAGFRLRASDRPKKDSKGASRRGSGAASRAGILEVTISAGVADDRDGEGNADETVAAADRALYSAKQNGRNKVLGAGQKRATKVRRA